MIFIMLEPMGIGQKYLRAYSEALRSKGHTLIAFQDSAADTATIIDRCRIADAVILCNTVFNEERIAGCSRLKLIASAYTGTDHIDLDACRKRGITVTNVPSYCDRSVAELTMGMIFALYRNLISCDEAVRSAGTLGAVPGRELFGKTVGVVGAGHIGSRVAALAQAFGCRVLYHSRTPKPALESSGATFTTLNVLLRESDIVTLHVPLTVETHGLIGAQHLAMMKKSAVLINTSRGHIVDSAALADALNQEVIAGAALDVYDIEPPLPADHPLLRCKNTVLSPHIAYATQEALIRRVDMVMDSILAWLSGNPKNIVV